jgi:hypothetical protein
MITLGYEYDGGAGMYSGCKQTYGGTSCEADGWSRLSNTVTFYDAPGSTHTIPASEPDAQASVLSGLCGADPKHTFTQAFNVPVKPKHIIWVTDSVPVITYTGNYTLKVNGATINVPDVAFHTPSTALSPGVRDDRR